MKELITCPSILQNSTPETQKQKIFYWSAASIIVLSYMLYYGNMITRHTALPYFDQTNYISRIYYIHDAWKNARHMLDYFNPNLILAGPYSARPPLLMIPPALLWGDHAHPHSVALLWLVIRMGVLMLAMVLMARLFKTARFVPAALLVILGSAFFLDVHPHQYQMDHAFVFFGFLAFALALWDLRQPSVHTATATALSTIMLLLIKPAALSFVSPIFCVLAARGIVWLVALLHKPEERVSWLAWAAVYVSMIIVIILLWKSPYGLAVAEHYKLASRGYWDWHMTLADAFQFITLIIPTWLLILLGLYLIWYRRIGMSKWVCLCCIATSLWWYIFNMFLAYTVVVDERYLTGGLAVGTTFALLVLCQNARIAILATTIASVLFVTNLLIAVGSFPITIGSPYYLQALLGPIAKAQRPVQEVGLLPLAEHIRAEVRKVHQPTEQVVVVTAVNDEYVEYSALNLAMRYTDGDVWSVIQFQPVPWGSTDFDLARLLQARWFLTKRQRNVVALKGDIWTSLYAVDNLITDPASPLHSHFEKRLDTPIEQPEFGRPGLFQPEAPDRMLQETVTLWYLAKVPTLSEQAKALRWIEPSFRNTPGHAVLLSQISRIEATTARGNGVDMIDAATAHNITTAADPSLRYISFNDRLRLLGIAQRRTQEGVELELAWESLQDQILDCVNFVHLLDMNKNIIGQLDYVQDQLKGIVKKGDLWRDVIRIPQAKLNQVETIGLGVTRPPSETFRTDHGPTDWDGHRLCIPVK